MSKKSFASDINKDFVSLIKNNIENQNDYFSKVIKLKLSNIIPNPDNPRKDFADIESLAKSIEENYLIQPIVVKKSGEKYQIITGERRYRAFIELSKKDNKYDEIPSIVMEEELKNEAIISLIENLQRENLTPIEESSFIVKIRQELDISQEELGKYIGKSRDYVNKLEQYFEGYKNLEKLGGIAQNEILQLSKSHIVHFSSKKEEEILSAFNYLKENNFEISEKQLRQFFKKSNNQPELVETSINTQEEHENVIEEEKIVNDFIEENKKEINNKKEQTKTVSNTTKNTNRQNDSKNEYIKTEKKLGGVTQNKKSIECVLCKNTFFETDSQSKIICQDCFENIETDILNYITNKSKNEIDKVEPNLLKDIYDISLHKDKANIYKKQDEILIFYDSLNNETQDTIYLNGIRYKKINQ